MAGYTKFDNPLLEKILTSGFTKRQLKILLLIVRFSSGCQKTYAVLRRNDYAYAGISPYCITSELEKLVKLRVIRWDSGRDLVWINPNLEEWAVDNPGEKSGDNLRKFFKIANKNLLKWQLAVYQNSKQDVAETAKVSTANKEKKEKVKKYYFKESTFLRILGNYFLNVSPLNHEQVFILRELVAAYGPYSVQATIHSFSPGEQRTFPHFLKALDHVAGQYQPRHPGFESIRSIVRQHQSNLENS
jgi:hypothetical protein